MAGTFVEEAEKVSAAEGKEEGMDTGAEGAVTDFAAEGAVTDFAAEGAEGDFAVDGAGVAVESEMREERAIPGAGDVEEPAGGGLCL